jgi:hypothetical protein
MKNSTTNTQYLYHYTSSFHLPMILSTGYLKLTESNLKEPKNTRIEYGIVVDDTMNYKPVVWLSDCKIPYGLGLDGSAVNKSEIRITIPKKEHYQYWLGWANRNRVNKKWQNVFISSTPNYKSWYVSEKIILLDDFLLIENTITGELIWSKEKGLIKPLRNTNFGSMPM